MNEKLAKVLSVMFPETHFVPVGINGATQLHFFNDTHECSITIFPRDEHLAAYQKSNEYDNDVVWLDNVRFATTSY